MRIQIILIVLASVASSIKFFGCSGKGLKQKQDQRARVIVTCDPELDDKNSMIRFLLFATDFEIGGVFLVSSQFYWKGDGKGTTQFIPRAKYDRGDVRLCPKTEWCCHDPFMDNLLATYEGSYPNLIIHVDRYPTQEYIRLVTKIGNTYFQSEYTYDSEGSILIKKVLLADKPGQVFVQAWGSVSSITGALPSILNEYENSPQWNSIYRKVIEKMIFWVGDQDNALNGYIRIKWLDLHIQSTPGSFMPFVYNGQRKLPDDLKFYFDPEWVAQNLLLVLLEHFKGCGDIVYNIPRGMSMTISGK